jgi:hypothetical protein
MLCSAEEGGEGLEDAMEGETSTGWEGLVEAEAGKSIEGRTEAGVGDTESVDEETAAKGNRFS